MHAGQEDHSQYDWPTIPIHMCVADESSHNERLCDESLHNASVHTEGLHKTCCITIASFDANPCNANHDYDDPRSSRFALARSGTAT